MKRPAPRLCLKRADRQSLAVARRGAGDLVDTIDIRLSDLTGKARIRHAALHLFGADGYAQTSLRSIAQTARVSLALIAHHFGSKHQLRDAVDAWMVNTFEKVAREVTLTHGERSSEERCRWFADAIGGILDAKPEVRAYLRRMVVVDGGPNGAALLASLLAIARGVVEHPPHQQSNEAELARRSLQWMLLMLGPSLLEPVLARCIPGLFAQPQTPARIDGGPQRPFRIVGGGADIPGRTEVRLGRVATSATERFRH